MKSLVPPEKLTEYLLTNPKKRGFFLPLAYALTGWMRLHDDLRDIAAKFPRTVRQITKHGTEVEIIGTVVAPNGRTITIRTGWILLNDDPDTLRFLTAYPA